MRRLLLLLILATTIFAVGASAAYNPGYTGSLTLIELDEPKIKNVTLISGGTWDTGQDYCFKMTTGGPGYNYYTDSINTYEMQSKPSDELCASDTTNATHRAFRICWTVVSTNFTTATGYGGAYLHGLWFTNETGNYTMERDGRWFTNAYAASPCNNNGHFCRAVDIEYVGGYTYCYNFSTFGARGYPYYEYGVPFIDLDGGTTTDPITPDDLYWFLKEQGRDEFIDRFELFPNSTVGASYHFKFFFGGYAANSNDSVFQYPSGRITYHEHGVMKFNPEYQLRIGEEYYEDTTGKEYLREIGHGYLSYGSYPTYTGLRGNTTIHGSYYGDIGAFDYPAWVAVYPTRGHGTQWNMDYVNITSSLVSAAGRFNFAEMRFEDNIFISNEPEFGLNFDYDDHTLGFMPHEIDNSFINSAYTNVEVTVKDADLSKMLYRFDVGSSTAVYWWCWIIRHDAGLFQNSTRTTHWINSPLPEPWRIRVYQYAGQGEDYQAYFNEEFETRLRVVDAVTGAPIENATLTVQDVNGSYCMGGKSVVYPSSVGDTYHLYPASATYFELYNNPTAFEVGDYLKGGMEFMRVTGVNATGINVTRGEFNTTPWGLQTVPDTGNETGGSYGNAFYEAWREQYSNSTGDFEEFRIVNRSLRLQSTDFVNGSWEQICPNWSDVGCANYGNYSDYAPFTITINASGYNNFTAYYTPTQENYFTIGLANTTECPDCPATVSMTGNAANGGVVVVKREVAQPAAAPVQQDSGFGEGLLLGGVLVGFVVLLGVFTRTRPNRVF